MRFFFYAQFAHRTTDALNKRGCVRLIRSAFITTDTKRLLAFFLNSELQHDKMTRGEMSWMRILKNQPPPIRRTQRITNRNYRYRWQYYVRHLYSEGFRVCWRQIRQHPGVMSLEPRIKREIANLRRQNAMMREEAGLAGALKCAHSSSEGSRCGKNETHAGLRLGRQRVE